MDAETPKQINPHLWFGVAPLPIQVDVICNEDGEFMGKLVPPAFLNFPPGLPFQMDEVFCWKCRVKVVDGFGTQCPRGEAFIG